MDDWVLCRIYKKVDKSIRTRLKDDDDRSPLIHNEDTNEFTMLDFDYNSVADSMDYSNSMDSFMHQSIPDESFTNFQTNDFPTPLSYGIHSKVDAQSLSMNRGQDDIWSVANLDFASQLDFYGVAYVEPLINLDNILSVDTPNKVSTNSKMNGMGSTNSRTNGMNERGLM